MPWLSSASHKFEIRLGEAISSAELQWTAFFKDSDVGSRTSKPGTPAYGTTNGITAEQIFTGPTTGIRTLVGFVCKNTDGISHTIRVQINDGSDVYSIANEPTLQVVPVNASLCYNEVKGWYVFGGTAPVVITASQPLNVTEGLIPNISLTIGGGTAGAGQYPSNSAAGVLTNTVPLDDAGVTSRLGGAGAPSESIGNVGSLYVDRTDTDNLGFYYKT